MLEEQTFHIRELKNRLVTRSHVISQEEETRSSPEVEKVFIWYKVILRLSRRWKRFFQKWKKYLPGRRLFSKVRIYIIGVVDFCWKSKLFS